MAKKRTRKVSRAKPIRRAKPRHMAKRVSSRASPRTSRTIRAGTSPRNYATNVRINLAIRNLLLFVILAAISYMLYTILSNNLFSSLFALLTIMFGFVALAFLIVMLVFIALKLARKSTVGEFPAPKRARSRRRKR